MSRSYRHVIIKPPADVKIRKHYEERKLVFYANVKFYLTLTSSQPFLSLGIQTYLYTIYRFRKLDGTCRFRLLLEPWIQYIGSGLLSCTTRTLDTVYRFRFTLLYCQNPVNSIQVQVYSLVLLEPWIQYISLGLLSCTTRTLDTVYRFRFTLLYYQNPGYSI